MSKKGYKQTEEHKRKISISNTGRKMSEEFKRNQSTRQKKLGIKPPSRLGFKHTNKFKKEKRKRMTGNKYSLGRKHTEEWKIENGNRNRGDKNHWWKGGITPVNTKIRNSFKYRQWRSDVFTRDNFICQECGKGKCYLEAHHLKEFHKIIKDNDIKTFLQGMTCEELWNINNGITLCSICHNKTK